MRRSKGIMMEIDAKVWGQVAARVGGINGVRSVDIEAWISDAIESKLKREQVDMLDVMDGLYHGGLDALGRLKI